MDDYWKPNELISSQEKFANNKSNSSFYNKFKNI